MGEFVDERQFTITWLYRRAVKLEKPPCRLEEYIRGRLLATLQNSAQVERNWLLPFSH